jgi:hypothetical protein
MIERLYAIRLKDGVDPDETARLVAVLEDAPRYIRSMRASRVRDNISRHPYDLLWMHAFDDLDGYLEYHAHPYHANLIDELMYNFSPQCITAALLPLYWDADEPAVYLRHVPPEEKWDVVHNGRGPQFYDGPIFLLERLECAGPDRDELGRVVVEHYVPRAEANGMRLIGSWRAPVGAGGHEIVLLWAVDGGWRGWDATRLRSSLAPETPALVEDLARVRTGGYRRFFMTDASEDTFAGRLRGPVALRQGGAAADETPFLTLATPPEAGPPEVVEVLDGSDEAGAPLQPLR